MFLFSLISPNDQTKQRKLVMYWAWLGKISVIFSAGWKLFGSSISVQKIQTGWTWLESHFFALVLCQEDLSSPACKWKTKWAGLYVVIFLDWFRVSWWLCTWFPSSHPVLFHMSWLYLLLTFSKYISFFLVWLKIKLFFFEKFSGVPWGMGEIFAILNLFPVNYLYYSIQCFLVQMG